jgi:hypothetical protein
MTGSTVVAIVGLVAALILAGRAMRARGLSGRKWLMMAITWTILILGTMIILKAVGLSSTPAL